MLSCRLFTAILKSKGVEAVYLPLDRCIHSKEEYNNQLDQSFYDKLRITIAKLVLEKSNRFSGKFVVPVVTGFIGLVPGGILNAIGRGYTDFTAALISAGLKTITASSFDKSINFEVCYLNQTLKI